MSRRADSPGKAASSRVYLFLSLFPKRAGGRAMPAFITRRIAKCSFFFWCSLSSFASAAYAQPKVIDKEIREFSILVDGKESGQSTMTIIAKDDGTTEMTASAAVKIRRLIFSYSFSIDSKEVWKNDKLVGMQNLSEEDGK